MMAVDPVPVGVLVEETLVVVVRMVIGAEVPVITLIRFSARVEVLLDLLLASCRPLHRTFDVNHHTVTTFDVIALSIAHCHHTSHPG